MKEKIVWFIVMTMAVSSVFASLRDPTKPATYQGAVVSKQAEHRQISAIIVGPKRKIAVMENAFLSVGDALNQDKVLEISEQGVMVQDQSAKMNKVHPFVEQEVKTLVTPPQK